MIQIIYSFFLYNGLTKKKTLLECLMLYYVCWNLDRRRNSNCKFNFQNSNNILKDLNYN